MLNNLKVTSEVDINNKKERNSSIELFRIITMFFIVAHHYVVNSGLIDVIVQNGTMKKNSIFLLLFGWGGKTGINCFVMITGYFMCKSNITVKKFLKLLLEIEFYKVIIYLIFLISGYSNFSIKVLIKTILPIYNIGTGFSNTYIVFFLFIPFLNILIKAINNKQHLSLIALCIIVFTIIPTFFKSNVVISYISWFMVIYLIAAYIRIYPNKWTNSKKKCGFLMVISLILSWCSVIAGAWAAKNYGLNIWYYFVADSNKILALLTAVAAFCFFKNLKIKHYKFINTVAASAFGVLLIHANSDDMRKWLWQDTFNNVSQYDSSYLVLHAIGSVIIIYIVCTLIDIVRIKIIEKPFFSWYDKRIRKYKTLAKS